MRTTSQEVEQLIILQLPSARAAVRYCAGSMRTTVRILQWMLDADWTSFGELLNCARLQSFRR